MRNVSIKIYQFTELSDEAKETAIQQLADINVNYDWWDYIYEDAKTIGIKITEFDLDRNRHCKGEFTEYADKVATLIINNHGESCETRKTAEQFLADYNAAKVLFEANDDFDPDFEEFYESDECDDLCDEFRRSILGDYSIMLQKEYEYLCSSEAITETIEANGYEFTEDGKQYR